MKMELLVDHILEPLKKSSTFAEDCRLKLMPNGVSFFVFNLPVTLLNALKDTTNEMSKMPI
jgi:hypothetical protein